MHARAVYLVPLFVPSITAAFSFHHRRGGGFLNCLGGDKEFIKVYQFNHANSHVKSGAVDYPIYKQRVWGQTFPKTFLGNS